jgi:ATP phosphoribosyltransferase
VLEGGVILNSEANLVASLRAKWSPRARAAAFAILRRISAEEEGRLVREVRAHLVDVDAAFQARVLAPYGARLPFGLHAPGGIVTIHCPADQVFALADAVAKAGAADVTVRTLDYVFRQANPLVEKLTARIG